MSSPSSSFTVHAVTTRGTKLMLVSLVPGIDDLVVAQTADGIRTEVQLNALAGGLEFDTRMAELRSQAGDRVEPSTEGSAQTACAA